MRVPAPGATALAGDWSLAALPPGTALTPAALGPAGIEWISCPGPLPAAAALRAAGRWSLDHPRDFDAEDWWYRCRFDAVAGKLPHALRFEGLATLADVWLNGEHLLRSTNMFRGHEVLAQAVRPGPNELHLRFQALSPEWQRRRARPRWKTLLTPHNQLRWQRTTLLGRMPGWCPPVAPVGPWRPVLQLPPAPIHIEDARLKTQLDGGVGTVEAEFYLSGGTAPGPAGRLTVGSHSTELEPGHTDDGRILLRAHLRIPDVEAWWPHTHGAPRLYAAELIVGDREAQHRIDLGPVGFRTLSVDRGADGQGFGLRVNGLELFCRGACWSPLDLASLSGPPEAYRAALEQVKSAGMNMIRVSGTMVYEEDVFYDLCDELGILVWQDFMFANLDYPAGDPEFMESVLAEAGQFLRRMQGRPSLAVLCGSSEVEQQAAMLGLAPERSASELFSRTLPDLCAELAPAVPWVASTPSGGTHPFQVDRGISHYYGVGAYRRPPDDARRAGVRFASECLAFANVPEPALVRRLVNSNGHAGRLDRWKAAIPRDRGSDWDFEDVRDHYLDRMFGLDSSALRSADFERYLELGRATTGELMERTMGEWRRPGSPCRGALVWLLRDSLPGAGWGLVDATGHPKSAWWYLRRACRPVALLVADEGLNGLFLHAMNDTPVSVPALLDVRLYRDGNIPVASASASLELPPRGALSLHADALFPGFLDLTYAYRFGPPGHQVVAATLTELGTGTELASAMHWPCGLPAGREEHLGLTAIATREASGYLLTLQSQKLAVAVAIRAGRYLPEDNFFTLEPERPRMIALRSSADAGPLRGAVTALNGTESIPIVVEER